MPDLAPADTARLERRLERARARIAILESMIEDKTRDLYLASEQLRETSEFLAGVLAAIDNAVIVVDHARTIVAVEGSTVRMTGRETDELIGRRLRDVVDISYDDDAAAITAAQTILHHLDGSTTDVLVGVSPIEQSDQERGAVIVATDVSQLRRLERELHQAQKLESVGRIASGVAHEINTPIQFVTNSVGFVSEAFADLLALADANRELRGRARAVPDLTAEVECIDELEEAADIEFVRDEGGRSLGRAKEGLDRIADIVRAMSRLAHPGSETLVPLHVAEVIESTLVVASGELKRAGTVETELRDVPRIMGDQTSLSQVLINLLVNAAHAIESRRDELGVIHVATCAVDGDVQVSVTDNGGGVPAEIRDQIFEPFFTTKELGAGTGQGLAISRTAVVDQHGGTLTLDVEDGVGSTFHIRIPAIKEQA